MNFLWITLFQIFAGLVIIHIVLELMLVLLVTPIKKFAKALYE